MEIVFDNQKVKYDEFGVRITEKRIWSELISEIK